MYFCDLCKACVCLFLSVCVCSYVNFCVGYLLVLRVMIEFMGLDHNVVMINGFLLDYGIVVFKCV